MYAEYPGKNCIHCHTINILLVYTLEWVQSMIYLDVGSYAVKDALKL